MLITAPFNTSPLIRRFLRVLLINSLLHQSSQMNASTTDCVPNVDARHLTANGEIVRAAVRQNQEEISSLAACLVESENVHASWAAPVFLAQRRAQRSHIDPE